jgi:hypothetical protein
MPNGVPKGSRPYSAAGTILASINLFRCNNILAVPARITHILSKNSVEGLLVAPLLTLAEGRPTAVHL